MKKLVSVLALLLGFTAQAHAGKWTHSSDYTSFTPATFGELGTMVGIGIDIDTTQQGEFLIKTLFPNAPAINSGKIAVGDMIVAVQNMPGLDLVEVTGKTIEDLAGLIRGAEGTPVTLKMLHAGAPYTVTLIRAVFEFPDEQP